MSNEAVSNQEHAQRIAYIEEQIRIIENKWGHAAVLGLVSIICFISGTILLLEAFKNQSNFYFFIGPSTIILGIVFWVINDYIFSPYAGQLKLLEEEFAAIATPEDWMKKPNPPISDYAPEPDYYF